MRRSPPSGPLTVSTGGQPRKLRTIPSPANLLAWFTCICPQSALRDPSEAIKAAEHAVSLDPTNFRYWNTLAIARYRADLLDESVEAMERSIHMQRSAGAPVRPNSLLFLAMALHRLGRHDEATSYLDETRLRLAEDCPYNSEITMFLAEARDLGLEL